MVMDEQLVADLKAARAELVARGRCTGRLSLDDGRVCALGAVAAATLGGELSAIGYDDLVENQRAKRVWGALLSALGQPPTPLDVGFSNDVDGFNDRRSTTDDDVLNLFDKALAELGGLA